MKTFEEWKIEERFNNATNKSFNTTRGKIISHVEKVTGQDYNRIKVDGSKWFFNVEDTLSNNAKNNEKILSGMLKQKTLEGMVKFIKTCKSK